MKNILTFLLILITFGCSTNNNSELSNDVFSIKYDNLMHSKIISKLPDSHELMNAYFPSEQLMLDNKTISDFQLTIAKDAYLDGAKGLILEGSYSDGKVNIKKELSVEIKDQFPDFLITKVRYTNSGSDTLKVIGWINNSYKILPAKNVNPPFWSFEGSSHEDRRDWVQPVSQGFNHENYMGMNASDYGGGTPICDIWRPDVGFAVGHLEASPKLVSIPVTYDSGKTGTNINISYKYFEEKKLAPGKSIETYETFVALHKGDYFHTLSSFSKLMETKGLTFEKFTPSTYQSEWCAWGYERNFTIKEVLGTLPKVSEMGYVWATLDDGWQTAEGDWYLNPKRFPNGDSDMKKFVDKIHKHHLKAMLWWAPLAVDPGTDLIKNHPEYLLLNKDGSKRDISWWDSYYTCPAYKPVVEYFTNILKKIIGEWGFDGLKIDGQHLNGVPPCYNKAHHHSSPEESVEKLPEFYKALYDAAMKINPDAVIQICPCGTAYSFYNLHYMNQTVASDPTSSWQVRLKGKTIKALMGNNAPYFGDHVELSDNGSDFASTVGVGGIVGTKFTYPTDNLDHKDHLLTKEKEIKWKKWLDIYKANSLSDAEYRGELYDLGYDKPETHAIQKDNTMYYAFYADKWDGKIELRGLKNKAYQIIDYVNDKTLATVNSESPKINVTFDIYLLIKAVPVD